MTEENINQYLNIFSLIILIILDLILLPILILVLIPIISLMLTISVFDKLKRAYNKHR